MKTWRRFLAAVVMIAMLTPMTAIGEDADTIIEALVIPDSQAEAVSETGETGATDVIAITDLDDSASATNADTESEDSVQTEEVQSENVEADPQEVVDLELNENGVESKAAEGSPIARYYEKTTNPADKALTYTIRLGDTFRIRVSGATSATWKASKADCVTMTAGTDEKGPYTDFKAVKENKKLKLTAALSGSSKKTAKVTFVIQNPYEPTSIRFTGMPDYIPAGGSLDLNDYIVMEPSYAKTTLTWKCSGAGKADKTGLLKTTKAGKAKITVTTKNKLKQTYTLEVKANKVQYPYGKPAASSIAEVNGGWTLWPVSIDVNKKGGLLCQFNLLNGTGDKVTQIRNLNLSIAAGNRSNIIAEARGLTVKASVGKGKSKAIKITLETTAQFNGVFMPNYYKDNKLFLNINQGGVKLASKTSSYDFIYTSKFPTPRGAESIQLNENAVALVVGNSLALSATVQPSNAENTAVVWSSDNEAVATVDNGRVTAVAVGMATITAEVQDGSNLSASCIVTVKEPMASDYTISEGIITGYTGAGGEIAIPAMDDNGNLITAIGDGAFSNNTKITKVIMGKDIVSIGSNAFMGCTSLSSLSISNNVKNIGSSAFDPSTVIFCALDSCAYEYAIGCGQPVNLTGYYSVSDAVIADGVIRAGVMNECPCRLSVAILNDDQTEVLSRAKIEIEEHPNYEECSFALADYGIVLPAYYVLRLSLLDEYDNEISDPFISSDHAQWYEEYSEKQPTDFPDSTVLVYDNHDFAVLNDTVKLVTGHAVASGYAVDSTSPISVGDSIYLENLNVTVKVASVSPNADGTVTVTSDNGAELEDFYQYIRCKDSVDVGDEQSVSNNATSSRNYQIIRVNSSELRHVIRKLNAAKDREDVVSNGEKELKRIEKSQNLGPLKVEASVSVSIGWDVMLDKILFPDEIKCETYAVLDGNFTATASKEYENSFKFELFNGYVPTSVPGMYVNADVTMPISLALSGEVELKDSFYYMVGLQYSNKDGVTPFREGKATSSLTGNAKFEGSIALRVGLDLCVLNTASIGVGATAGITLDATAAATAYDLDTSYSREEIHGCKLCLDWEIDGFINLDANIEAGLMGERTKLEKTWPVKKWTILTGYLSLLNDEESIFGGKLHLGINKDCPNKKYRVDFVARDLKGNNISVPVTVYKINEKSNAEGSGSSEKLMCSKNTTFSEYLYAGKYRAEAQFLDGRIKKDFTIKKADTIVIESAGTITGTVRDQDTKEPLKDVAVSCEGVKTTTDGSGRYELKKIAAGKRTVSFKKEEYSCDPLTVEVIAEQEVTLNAFMSKPKGTISGTVTDKETHKAIKGVSVSCEDNSTTTGPDGKYTLKDVPVGEREVSFTKTGYTCDPKTVTVKEEETSTLNAQMIPKKGTIAGTVTDQKTGQVLRGVAVSWEDKSTSTDADGSYTLKDVLVGNQMVSFTLAGYDCDPKTVTVNENETSLLNAQMTAMKGTISGTVTDKDTGKGISGVYVYCAGLNISTTTDADGKYTMKEVLVGKRGILFEKRGYGSISIDVVVADNKTVTANAKMTAEKGSIKGTVTDKKTGKAISGVTVTCLEYKSTKTDNSGKYTFKDVPVGENNISFEKTGYNNLLQTVTVIKDTTATLDVSLEIPGSDFIIQDGVVTQYIGSRDVTEITIPDKASDGKPVTAIGDHLFESSFVTSVHIPDSVTSIGDGAFLDCQYLTSINMPKKLTHIGNGAFRECYRLSTPIILPDGLTSIGINAFAFCFSIPSVSIPSSVTNIGSDSFFGCRGITHVSLQEGLSQLSDYMFSQCTGLTSITIPSSIAKIPNGTFDGCRNLMVSIPHTVRYIGDVAFAYCNVTGFSCKNVISIGARALLCSTPPSRGLQ